MTGRGAVRAPDRSIQREEKEEDAAEATTITEAVDLAEILGGAGDGASVHRPIGIMEKITIGGGIIIVGRGGIRK